MTLRSVLRPFATRLGKGVPALLIALFTEYGDDIARWLAQRLRQAARRDAPDRLAVAFDGLLTQRALERIRPYEGAILAAADGLLDAAEAYARATPDTRDDQLVAFLRALLERLADGTEAAAATVQTMKPERIQDEATGGDPAGATA
ncbi:MAG: hypothetical protein AAGC60_00290 [Acidobacteriota bacterium]